MEISGTGAGEVVVVTGDQVVTHPTLGILEKPVDLREAGRFMEAYREVPEVTTVGSVLFTHHPSGLKCGEVFEAKVRFDKGGLERDEEDRRGGRGKGILTELVEADAPVLKCAGGLMVENRIVKKFIKEIEGGEDAVLGLSRRSVLRCLGELDKKLS